MLKEKIKDLYSKLATTPNWMKYVFFFLLGAAYHAIAY